jgi:separase
LTGSYEQLGSSDGRKDGVEGSPFDCDSDNDEQSEDLWLAEYWASIRAKYEQLSFNLADLACSKMKNLPVNWTTIHIYVTEDRNTMFICRQRANQQPLVFSLPLKGRREAEEDGNLSFEDAIAELREIVHLSDQSTKGAINVKGQDKSARTAWWADRMALDNRLQKLLESIEFCWFGAFKVPTKLADF